MTDWQYIKLAQERRARFNEAFEKGMVEAKMRFTKEKREELLKSLKNELKNLDKTIENRKLKIDFLPKNELGVVSLFGRYFDLLGFEKIVSIDPTYPDCTAIKNGKEVKIEFEYLSSRFLAHHTSYHNPEECDYVVCWKDDIDLKKPKTIALSEKLIKIFKNNQNLT